MSDDTERHEVGLQIGPLATRWTERDVILYALGIGGRLPRDLTYLYEGAGADGPCVAPTFALALTTKLLEPLITGLAIDRRGLLHVGQSLSIERLPHSHGSAVVTREVVAVADKGHGRLITCQDMVLDSDGVLARAESVWWIQTSLARSARGPRKPASDPRAPDRVVVEPTTTELAALPRLSGDYNPMHIDPEMARAAGQPRPFLHGLATFGFLGFHLERSAPRDMRVASLTGRFTRPVFPGDSLTIAVWVEALTEVRARVSTDAGVVLDEVSARYAPAVAPA
jgi:acyl dehydratase